MVLEVNAPYHAVNKFVVHFLTNNNVSQEVINIWKSKGNTTKLRLTMRKTDGPTHPKRVMSEYLFFCQQIRPKIIEEQPKLSIKEVTCELGRRWQIFKINQDVDPKLKQFIKQAFAEDKLRYDEEKKNMIPKKEKRNPKSVYLFFCEQERKKESKITMKELGIRWGKVKDDQTLHSEYTRKFEVQKAANEQIVEP